jgi:hypothetical protein
LEDGGSTQQKSKRKTRKGAKALSWKKVTSGVAVAGVGYPAVLPPATIRSFFLTLSPAKVVSVKDSDSDGDESTPIVALSPGNAQLLLANRPELMLPSESARGGEDEDADKDKASKGGVLDWFAVDKARRDGRSIASAKQGASRPVKRPARADRVPTRVTHRQGAVEKEEEQEKSENYRPASVRDKEDRITGSRDGDRASDIEPAEDFRGVTSNRGKGNGFGKKAVAAGGKAGLKSKDSEDRFPKDPWRSTKGTKKGRGGKSDGVGRRIRDRLDRDAASVPVPFAKDPEQGEDISIATLSLSLTIWLLAAAGLLAALRSICGGQRRGGSLLPTTVRDLNEPELPGGLQALSTGAAAGWFDSMWSQTFKRVANPGKTH